MWLSWAKPQTWGKNGGTFTGGPPKIVIHTTETRTWPGYSSGATAPHLTCMALPMSRSLVWRQHSPLDLAARALQNKSGGVQTNRDHAIQIELIGTCDRRYKGTYPDAFGWYDAPDWALLELGKSLRELCQVVGVQPVSTGRAWQSYPDSYGINNHNRMTKAEWDEFNGICGHQHVPENSHGDPGSLNIPRALVLSKPVILAPVSSEEDDVERILVTAHGTGAFYLIEGAKAYGLGSIENVNAFANAGVKIVKFDNERALGLYVQGHTVH